MPEKKDDRLITKPMPVRYTGNQEYVFGVPMRDMTLEEWEAIPLRLRHAARHLYTGIPKMDEEQPVEVKGE